MSEKDRFVRHLESDPTDWDTRLIYSDYLLEHDEPEEAERQRAWKESYEWMQDFTKRCGRTCVNYGIDTDYGDGGELGEGSDDWVDITYEDVIKAGYTAWKEDDWFIQVGDERARNITAGETRILYWRHWQVLTGEVIPKELEKRNPFSCTC